MESAREREREIEMDTTDGLVGFWIIDGSHDDVRSNGIFHGTSTTDQRGTPKWQTGLRKESH